MTAGDFDIPTLALAELPVGVHATPNPNLDAPQRHRWLRPTVSVAVKRREGKKWRDGSMTLDAVPRRDGEIQVGFFGGPRGWWDRPDAIIDPAFELEALQKITQRAANRHDRRQVAARLPQANLRGEMTMVTVRYRRRDWLSMSMTGSTSFCITWLNPKDVSSFNDTILVCPATLHRAVEALRRCAEQAEIIPAAYGL